MVKAIENRRHGAARLLLAHGVSLSAASSIHGYSWLHFIALCGDEEMMAMFEAGFEKRGGRDVSPTMKAKKGRTPMVLFEEQNPTEELRMAFEGLLRVVEEWNGEREDEVFYDADDGTKYGG